MRRIRLRFKMGKELKEFIKEELKFLEEHLIFVRTRRVEMPGLQPFQYPIAERIKYLRNKLKEDSQ